MQRLAICGTVLMLVTLGLASWLGADDRTSTADARSRFNAIPLDVTFPDAEALIAERAAQAGTAAAGSRVDWSKLIPVDAIKNEIALESTLLKDATKNPGFFKSSGAKSAETHFAMMAAMFHMGTRYGAETPWDATSLAALRDMTAEAYQMAVFADDDAFAAAQKSVKEVDNWLTSGKTTAEPAGNDPAWSDEVLPFYAIMRRMETAQRSKLQPWTASQNDFVAKKDELIHEATVLAALAQIMMDESYPLAGEGDYLNWAKTFRDNSLGIVEAAKANDFEKASDFYRDNNVQCDSCHGVYR
jgi:hypothetical protein